ncbi:MAG: pilus assembly protein [Gemmatimonadales bacterium]|nr:pilus assembly protein [Gemmatimonadales bacterium]
MRSLRGARGQALVEFALILPVILLLVVGMLEFARAWNLHQVMTDAAREGARIAVLDDDVPQDSVKAAMWRHLAQFGYDPQYADMDITPDDKFKVAGEPITVDLSLPYRFAILGPTSILMRSTFTMRNE